MAEREQNYELVIVGGGPAGLSAAVNGASEALSTLVLDGDGQFGGQAGTSTLIENYAGFPEGVTGEDLAFKMVDQAVRFGAELQAPLHVEAIDQTAEGMIVRDDTETILARTVLISSGVQYRRSSAKNISAYLGRGVRYGSPNLSAKYKNQDLYVVGGANSAGQAALHLAKYNSCNVHMLVRGEDIRTKMSAYLADRIDDAENIEVHTKTEVTGAVGKGRLENITLTKEGEEITVDADRLFLLIGAKPRTAWLPESVAKDKYGFVLAGGDLPEEVRNTFAEDCGRQPNAHETSIPGLFVAGDIRSGSIKRVASAAGDGAGVIQEVHRYLG